MAITTPTKTRRLRVERYDAVTNISIELGTLDFGPSGQLTLVSARPGYERLLQDIVGSTNAREEIVIKVPPPPGGKPMGIYHLSVPRTSPDLLDRLMEYFEQKYDLMLMEQASA